MLCRELLSIQNIFEWVTCRFSVPNNSMRLRGGFSSYHKENQFRIQYVSEEALRLIKLWCDIEKQRNKPNLLLTILGFVPLVLVKKTHHKIAE